MTVCLVTGGAGFIGSHIVEALVAQGDSVRVLDNLSTGKEEHLKGLDVELIKGDIRKSDDVSQAIRSVQTVVHLAAQTNVINSINDPLYDCDSNVKGTLNLLNACVKNNAKRFAIS